MKPLYQTIPLALVLGLVGCNSEKSDESTSQEETKTTTESTTPAVTEKAPEFISKLPESAPTLKVAVTNHGAPFVVKDEYGVHKGIDIDLIRAIGEIQGFKVQLNTEKWKDLMPSIENGKYDLAINGINYSEERNQKYGLSNSYFYNPSAIMYIDGTQDIKDVQDLKGLKVQVVEQSKQYSQLKEVVEPDALTTVPASFLLFKHLIQGKADAIAMDMPILQHTARQFPETKVTFVPYEDESNPAANTVIVMAKGNDELISKINEGIDKIKASGEYAEIKEKWLGTAK